MNIYCKIHIKNNGCKNEIVKSYRCCHLCKIKCAMSCDKSSSSSTCQEITDKSPKMFKINDSVKVKKVLLHDGIIWIDGKMEKFIGKTFKIKDVLISNGLYLLENDFWYPEEALELDE